MPLPPSFTSLYRLTLRALSASVSHESRRVRQLRALWRPVFDGHARLLHRLEKAEEPEGDRLRRQTELWESQRRSSSAPTPHHHLLPCEPRSSSAPFSRGVGGNKWIGRYRCCSPQPRPSGRRTPSRGTSPRCGLAISTGTVALDRPSAGTRHSHRVTLIIRLNPR